MPVQKLGSTIKTTDSFVARMDKTSGYLIARMDETNKRIDDVTISLGRLYEVIVRKEEQEKLEIRVLKLEEDISYIKEKIAA